MKWNPFRDILFLQDRMSRLFDEALSQYKGGCLPGSSWFPPVDIYETENEIILKAELPGVEMKNISVEVNENVITLKGEKKLGKNLCEENYHRMERFYGTFQRVFSLPNSVEKSNVKANYRDGVLEITVPKAAEVRPEAVKIAIE